MVDPVSIWPLLAPLVMFRPQAFPWAEQEPGAETTETSEAKKQRVEAPSESASPQ